MCNAWNHPAGCDCGFGGDTGGGWGTATVASPVRSSWLYRNEDFCRPTSCPVCGAAVFFVRHNGGSVWFDELGPPWPKHACFDDDPIGRGFRSGLVKESTTETAPVFGVVIETVATRPGQGGRIIVRCSDGTILDNEFNATLNLSTLVGQLVRVERDDEGQIRLVPVGPLIPPPLPPILPPPTRS